MSRGGVRPADYPPPFSPSEVIAPPTDPTSERIEVGVLIVGAGPAGLACAIRLGQLLEESPETAERLGEVPVAVVHGRDGSGLDEERLRAFLHGRLAAFKIPARMIFSTAPLPRLGTGKIDRVELKKTYGR
jgi:acyl-CoA synthetase (AMP-forming)/AMP-acid ligase II